MMEETKKLSPEKENKLVEEKEKLIEKIMLQNTLYLLSPEMEAEDDWINS